jgi:hypothetical protein
MSNAILLGKGFNSEISGRYSLTVAPTALDQHRKEHFYDSWQNIPAYLWILQPKCLRLARFVAEIEGRMQAQRGLVSEKDL